MCLANHMKALFFFSLILCCLNSCGNARTDDSLYLSIAKKRLSSYRVPRKDYVILIDYRKDIHSERLFLMDMKEGSCILRSKVSHAFNSGTLYASDFSNKEGSKKSSRGNYVTLGPHNGPMFGYGMLLKGLDRGINDMAEKRAIIFHSNKNMASLWSWGCFATDEEVNKKIVGLTKNGCLVSVITSVD